MATFPRYQDTPAHAQYGKSSLPIMLSRYVLKQDYPLHSHHFAELSLVIEGKGTEIVNGKEHRFRRGTVSFLLPHHMHEIRLDHPAVQKYNCMFDINLLYQCPSDRDLANLLLTTGEKLPSHYELNEEQTTEMIALFDSMFQEYESKRFAKDSFIRAKLMEAFIYLIRSCLPPDGTINPGLGLAKPKDEGIMEILRYLHVYYQEEITLSTLAARFNRNASYISRLFRQNVGQTFTEYLHSLRIGRAAGLLATTSMSITDIAMEVGFDQSRTFTRVFKEIKGMTPKQYRAAYQIRDTAQKEFTDNRRQK